MTYLFNKPDDGNEYVETFIEGGDGVRKAVYILRNKSFVIGEYLREMVEAESFQAMGLSHESPSMPDEIKTWLSLDDLTAWESIKNTFTSWSNQSTIDREEAQEEFRLQCEELGLDYSKAIL